MRPAVVAIALADLSTVSRFFRAILRDRGADQSDFVISGMTKHRLSASPPDHEFLEADVAISLGIGHFEIELAFRARNVAVEGVQQGQELVLVYEAVTI